MTKRKIALVLAMMLVLSLLAGCGGKETGTTETKAPATEAPVTEALQENNMALGIVEGNTYSNTYVNIGVTLDSGWVLYGADALQEWPDAVKEMMEGSELGDALADVTQFTDMYAENVEGLTNMNILFQKLTLQQRLAYATMDEQEVLEATLGQKDLMVEAYAQGGINVESMEIVKVTFLGKEHYAMKTVAETQGVAYYCLQVFDYWLGEYSVTITLASFLEDNTEAMLELFYELN